jgi:hypothetical protein
VRSASKWSPRLLKKKRVCPGVVGGIVQGAPALLPQFQRAHLSTKLPVLVHAPRQFCQCLWLYA